MFRKNTEVLDCNESLQSMEQEPFEPICATNINNLENELEICHKKLIEKNMPLGTTHQQAVPSLISSLTSNLMRKRATEKFFLQRKPAKYRKSKVMQFRNTVTSHSQDDNNDHQNKTFGSRNTGVIHFYLKKLVKNPSFPLAMTFDRVTESISIGKANLFNRFFFSVFSSKSHKKWKTSK